MMTTFRARVLPAFAFAATLFLAACGDDDPTRPDDALTDAEITALVDALFVSAVDPELPGDGAASGPAAAASVSFPIDDTVPCTLGGSIRMRGAITVTVDDTEESGTYEHEITQTHQNCSVRAQNLTFVFAGAPSVVSTVEAEIEDGEVVEFEGAEEGTVRWTLGERQGRCEVEVEYTIAPTPPANLSYRVTGKVCGRPIDRVVTAS